MKLTFCGLHFFVIYHIVTELRAIVSEKIIIQVEAVDFNYLPVLFSLC